MTFSQILRRVASGLALLSLSAALHAQSRPQVVLLATGGTIAGAGASAVYTVPGDTRTPSIRAASYASSGSIVRGNPSHITTPRSGTRHSTSSGKYSRSAAASASRRSR